MKTSIITLLAVPAFFTGIFAAPTVDTTNAVTVEKRQVADAYGIVETLYQDIQQYTGAISNVPLPSHHNTTALTTPQTDETTASLTPTSSLADRNAAAASNRDNIDAITALISSAADQVDGLSAAKMLFRRQTGATLAGLVSNLLIEISSTLNGIIGSLGLGEWESPEGRVKRCGVVLLMMCRVAARLAQPACELFVPPAA